MGLNRSRGMLATLLGAVALSLASVPPAFAAEVGEFAAQEALHIAETFPGRMPGTPMEDRAAQYLADRLLGMGYRPKLARFSTSYAFQWTQEPGRDNDYRLITSTNVIAERPGTSGKQIIVGAHYDSRPPRRDTDLNPERRTGGPELEGLDDNASGSGIWLELAKHFAATNPTHTIKFIGFGAEEVGLKGAIEVVERMTPEEREATLWMVNIDSIVTGDRLYFHAGPKTYAEDKAAGHARDRALAIAADLGIEAATNPGLNEEYPKGTGCCSDQAAFDRGGIPVVNLEATNWRLGDLDGYQQTEVSECFPEGYSWHLVDIDNIEHLGRCLPEGRLEQRTHDVMRILIPLVEELAGVAQ